MGKYSGSFTSLKGVTYTVEISASWLSNKTLILDADPVHLVVNEAKTKFPGLRTTECEINVLSSDPMTELFSEDLMAVTVRLHHSGVTDFIGFLETSEWEAPCAPGRIEPKQLVAVDGLSAFLQKTCYERSFRSMLSVMNDIKSELNAKLPVSVSYDGSLLSETSIYGAYINIDSLQPTDLYEKSDIDGNWVKWGALVNAFAEATGSTIMMVGNKIKAYYVDTESGVWCTSFDPMETRLTTTSMSMKMVNSVRRVEQDVKTLQNLKDPEAVDPTVRNWYVSAGHDRPAYYFFGKAVAYHYTTGLEKYWTEDSSWPSGLDARTHAVCAVSFADDRHDLDPSSPSEWMVGVRAISDPVHVFPGHDSSGYTTLTIKADIHTNTHEEEEQMQSNMSGFPCIWDSTITERIDDPTYSTIALKINGVIVLPSQIKPLLDDVTHSAHIVGESSSSDDEYNEDAPKWLTYYYYFRLPESLLEDCDYKPRILVRSQRRGGSIGDRYIGYSFAKKIRLCGPGYEADDILKTDGYEDKTLNATASGKDFGQVMNFDCKMCNEPWYSGFVNGGGIALRNPLQQLATQYAVPRQQWQATVDDGGFDPTKKAWCRGSLCTQIASDWNLRYGEVTVTVMS